MLGLGIGLGACAARGIDHPASLFMGAARGLVLDPTILTSLYQDSAGTVPVTAPGQPVGRVLDQSGRANHATQGTPLARPTYRLDIYGRAYLDFDGLDDALYSPNFQWGTNEVTVIAAVQKDSDANIACVAALGGYGAEGGWRISAPASSGTQSWGGFSAAGTNRFIAATGAQYAAPKMAVVSLQAKTSAPFVRLRVNGAQVAESTATQGATTIYAANVSSAILIGTWYSSERLDGRIYGLIAINRLLTPAELSNAERWATARFGATPS